MCLCWLFELYYLLGQRRALHNCENFKLSPSENRLGTPYSKRCYGVSSPDFSVLCTSFMKPHRIGLWTHKPLASSLITRFLLLLHSRLRLFSFVFFIFPLSTNTLLFYSIPFYLPMNTHRCAYTHSHRRTHKRSLSECLFLERRSPVKPWGVLHKMCLTFYSSPVSVCLSVAPLIHISAFTS